MNKFEKIGTMTIIEIILCIISLGFVCPFLISSPSTENVILGIIILLANLVLAYILGKKMYHIFKK